jgi:hypothetical protein
MSKSLDQLARNLAGGMSRRKAIWQFVSGLGVVAALTGRKAYADDLDQHERRCRDFCHEQAETFKEYCLQASDSCAEGYCADVTLNCGGGIGINGGLGINGTGVISVNGSPYTCVPVYRT